MTMAVPQGRRVEFENDIKGEGNVWAIIGTVMQKGSPNTMIEHPGALRLSRGPFS